MEFGRAYDLSISKRQFRQRLSLPVRVSTTIPETHEWRVVDINLGGVGIGIPLQFDQDDDKSTIIEKNTFPLELNSGDDIFITIHDGKYFAEPFEVTLKILHIQSTSMWNEVPMVYFMGCSFSSLSDQKFWQLEKVFMLAKRGH